MIGVDQVGLVEERGIAAIVARPVAGVGRDDEVAGTPEIKRPSRVEEHPPAGLHSEHDRSLGIGELVRRAEELLELGAPVWLWSSNA